MATMNKVNPKAPIPYLFRMVRRYPNPISTMISTPVNSWYPFRKAALSMYGSFTNVAKSTTNTAWIQNSK